MTSFSYWEQKHWFKNIDFLIVGSGICGLSSAYHLAKKNPKAKIVILEKGILPQGASTKNAGFACFGSLSEILNDIKKTSENEVFNLVEKRKKGLELLLKITGENNISFKNFGSYELFFNNDNLFDDCKQSIEQVNNLIKPIVGKNTFSISDNKFGFDNINKELIFNQYEGQIDTGKMMKRWLKLVSKLNVSIINGVSVNEFSQLNDSVQVKTSIGNLSAKNLVINTNGFAKEMLDLDVNPARAQVIITKPIKNLNIKGTFHLDEGFYYFRNVKNRILFGGGRNLDIKGETTTEFGTSNIIQDKLKEILNNTILPNKNFEIESSWSGIMATGQTKKPIVKQLSNNVFCGIRLGGMGIAIGSLVGKEISELVDF